MSVYKILEAPIIYKTAQAMLAPGMKQVVTERLQKVLGNLPNGARILDVGCGPISWLLYLGMQPIGLDLSHAYMRQYRDAGGTCITASASQIPFAAETFDLVLSVALLHHLPEEIARWRSPYANWIVDGSSAKSLFCGREFSLRMTGMSSGLPIPTLEPKGWSVHCEKPEARSYCIRPRWRRKIATFSSAV